jgi:glutathione S-transferase
MIGSVVSFARRAGRLDQSQQNLTDYLARLEARPAYERAREATAPEPAAG